MIDLLILILDPADSQAPESVDLVARLLAIGGYAITIGIFVYGRRGKLWRGRSDSTRDLRPFFDEVRDTIAGAEQDSRNAALLWTVPVSDALAQLRSAGRTIPDRKLCRLLAELLKDVTAAKGDAPPTPEQSELGAPLSAEKHAALKHAGEVAVKIEERLDAIAKKGATG